MGCNENSTDIFKLEYSGAPLRSLLERLFMKLEIRLELKSSSVNPNKQVQCQFVLMETDCRSAINEQSSSPTKEAFS